MSEAPRVATIRAYVAAVSDLDANKVIPKFEKVGRRPTELHADVRVISDEDLSVSAVKYRDHPTDDTMSQQKSSTARRSRYQVDFVGDDAQQRADTFVRNYPLLVGTNLETEHQIAVQRVTRLNAPELEGKGWREGASIELDVDWFEESAWVDVEAFDSADVRTVVDGHELQTDIALTD